MAFANSDWDAQIDANNGRINGLGRRAQQRGMTEDIARMPQDTLDDARLDAEYQIGGISAVKRRLLAQQPPSQTTVQRAPVRGPQVETIGHAPQRTGAGLGLPRSLDADYYGRTLAAPIAAASGAAPDYAPDTNSEWQGTGMGQDAAGLMKAPVAQTQRGAYADQTPEPQKIDIKFAPSDKQPVNVRQAFGGQIPEDIHETDPGTVSNDRQQFLDDVTHLQGTKPDPGEFANPTEYAAAARDWEDKNHDVMSRMDQHAAEARRIGKEDLAQHFDKLASGYTPQQVAQSELGSGSYRATNAATAQAREQRLGDESKQRLALAGRKLDIAQNSLNAKMAPALTQRGAFLKQQGSMLSRHLDTLTAAGYPDTDPRVQQAQQALEQYDSDVDNYVGTLPGAGGAGLNTGAKRESWKDYQ